MTNAVTDITTRDEWVADRRAYLGASDIPAMLELSPYQSRWGLWAEKVGLIDRHHDDGGDDDRLEFGREIEPALVRMFERRHPGYGVIHFGDDQRLCRHPDLDWAVCNPDGFVVEAGTDDPDYAIALFEAKSRGGALGWEQVPVDIRAQCQWQMFCTDVPTVFVVVEHVGNFGGKKLGTYQVERDDADIAFIFDRADRFWHRHVQGGEPPDVDATRWTTKALSEAWPTVREVPSVDLTPLADVVADWRQLKAALKKLGDREQHAANKLRAALGVHTEGLVDGQLAVSWRQSTYTNVDIGQVRADHGDRYDTAITRRTLRSHTSKGNQ